MIRIICLGKIKEEYLKQGIDDYFKRISKYHKIEIVELKDDNDIDKESTQILKYLNSAQLNIAMDIQGTKISSVDLSKIIDQSFNNYASINFIIGSSNGLSNEVKALCQKRISFGNITMPHGLFRLVLLEQIYRGFKINNNESYHK